MKYKVQKGLLFTFVLLLFACQTERTLEPHPPYDAASSFTIYPIVVDQMAVLPLKLKGDKEGLVSINIYSGDTLWSYMEEQCRDLYYNLRPTFTEEALYIPFNNGLLSVDRTSYAVDYVPLIKEGFIQSQLVSYGDNVVGAQALENRRKYEIFSFDTQLKTFTKLQSFATDTARRLLMRAPQIIKNPQSKRPTFASPVVDFKPKDTTFSYFLFWAEGGTIDSLPAVSPNIEGIGATRMTIVSDSLALWLVDSEWVAINIPRRTEVWRKPLGAKMLTSQPLLLEDTLFCAMENRRLYAIQSQTGDTLWTQRIAGTPSRVYARDSTLHLIGGSDGRYYRFHRGTGEPIPIPKTDAFFARTFYTDEAVTVVRIKNQWLIGSSIESIVAMQNAPSASSQ